MFRARERSSRRWPKVLALVLIIVALAIGGGVYYMRQWYQENLQPLSSTNEAVVVTIPTGASLDDIALLLEQHKVIRSARAFRWYIRSQENRDNLKAGTYRFRPSQSTQEITAQLIEGNVATDLFTILPAQRLDQINKAFVEAGYSEEETNASLSADQYTGHPALTDKPAGASLEGYLYPESFQKTSETHASDIVRQSLDEMQKRLTPEIRAGIAKQGLTLHEGITLASIIEQEVSKDADRKTVAQVFLRRLRQNMELGSDVTFFYAAAVTGQKPSPSLDSPYNTRMYPGLPPGPISNVSAASLNAVANPDTTDYLYFVSGDDGKTYFSHTEEEHNALAKAHCKKLCELP